MPLTVVSLSLLFLWLISSLTTSTPLASRFLPSFFNGVSVVIILLLSQSVLLPLPFPPFFYTISFLFYVPNQHNPPTRFPLLSWNALNPFFFPSNPATFSDRFFFLSLFFGLPVCQAMHIPPANVTNRPESFFYSDCGLEQVRFLLLSKIFFSSEFLFLRRCLEGSPPPPPTLGTFTLVNSPSSFLSQSISSFKLFFFFPLIVPFSPPSFVFMIAQISLS